MVVKSYLAHRARLFEKAVLAPMDAQARALKSIVERVGCSAIGRRFELDRVRNLQDARSLPMTSENAMATELSTVWTEGVRASHLFGKSKIVALAQSAGTSGDPKRMPINQDYLKAYQSFMMRMNGYFFHKLEDPSFFLKGKALSISSSSHVGNSPGGLPVGYISGIITSKMPRIFRSKLLPSDAALQIQDWEERMDRILREAHGQNIRSVSGIPVLAISFLEQAMAKLKISSFREIWPELRAYVWGGTALLPAEKSRLMELFGIGDPKQMICWETYGGTEGQFGHSFGLDGGGMVFNPFENFYQFRERSLDDSAALPVQLHELEVGKEYAILVTTPGGLVNYRMKDWIEVLSQTPVTFRVSGRDHEEINLAAEKITLSHVSKALDLVLKAAGLERGEFAVFVRGGKPHRLVWAFSVDVASALGKRADALDEALSTLNSSYRRLRGQPGIYGMPEITEIPHEAFKKYNARNIERSGAGQFKPKRLFLSEESFRQAYGI